MQKFWLTTLLVASIANGIENNPPYPVAETAQLPIEVYSEEFANLLGAEPKLVHLARGFGFTEGPVFLGVKDTDEGYLLFTDQINDNILIMRWHGIKPYDQITPLSWSAPVIFGILPASPMDKPLT
jgi:gluconolactonase